MAVIGSFGKLVFSVSRNKIEPIRNVSWNSSAKYAEHNRHLRDPLVEFTGNANDKITFDMIFSAYLGVNPVTELNKLLKIERTAEANRLIIGNKAYGKGKWVITDVGKQLQDFDKKGNLLVAAVSVSLLAYPTR